MEELHHILAEHGSHQCRGRRLQAATDFTSELFKFLTLLHFGELNYVPAPRGIAQKCCVSKMNLIFVTCN
jgi:hypothetical protein